MQDQADSAQSTALPGDLETSLAPRDGDLLSLPFDQYGRMRIAQNLAHILYTEIARFQEHGDGAYRMRVLDVGGYPGILRHFLPQDNFEISVLDVGPDDGSIPNYVQGSGMELPFEDDSFDLVFSLDTLEHIPGHERPRFLAEIMRVARLGSVLINPIQSLPVDLAEETLDEYVRWILDAQQEQLAEHRGFGLPDFAATTEAFNQAGWQTHTFKLANIYNWLFMMIAKHYLISMQDEKASAFERALDRYYNLAYFEADRAEPNYRGALVAVRPGLEQALLNIQEAYPPVESNETANATRLGLTQVLMSLLNLKSANHEDRALREQIEHRQMHIAGMETRIATLDLQVHMQNQQIVELQSIIRQKDANHEAEMIKLQEHIRNIEVSYTDEFARQKEYIARIEDDRKSKDEHIAYLENLLKGVESGRVFRLTRTVSRLIKR